MLLSLHWFGCAVPDRLDVGYDRNFISSHCRYLSFSCSHIFLSVTLMSSCHRARNCQAPYTSYFLTAQVRCYTESTYRPSHCSFDSIWQSISSLKHSSSRTMIIKKTWRRILDNVSREECSTEKQWKLTSRQANFVSFVPVTPKVQPQHSRLESTLQVMRSGPAKAVNLNIIHVSFPSHTWNKRANRLVIVH